MSPGGASARSPGREPREAALTTTSSSPSPRRGRQRCRPLATSGFNPRPRTRSDGYRDANGVFHWTFQSTPPHKERHSDHNQRPGGVRVSIHTPAQGAKRQSQPRSGRWHRFNPRPAQRTIACVGCAVRTTTAPCAHSAPYGAQQYPALTGFRVSNKTGPTGRESIAQG
jgi:hypothetical protein